MLLLGVWLGAAIFFSAAVAPSVFAVLREAQLANDSTLAGSIVNRLLGTINRGGFEIALFLITAGYFAARGQKRWARVAEMLSLAIMAIMTGIGEWIISARLSALRAAMQLPIDQIAPADPRRVEFDSLHRYSVVAMSIAIIAALVGFVFIASRNDRTGASEKASGSGN